MLNRNARPSAASAAKSTIDQDVFAASEGFEDGTPTRDMNDYE